MNVEIINFLKVIIVKWQYYFVSTDCSYSHFNYSHNHKAVLVIQMTV